MAAILFGVLALGALYWFRTRRWFARWGATASDLTRIMPGDAAAVDPSYSATMAITVGARPEHIWPWLVQMGYQRGGLYSYDWLDRLFGYLDRQSAHSILPEFQRLAVGDEIPIGRGQGFPVTAIEPNRALVLSGTGSDGSMGVQAIKKMGGTVLAQDESSSEFFGMPYAAIQTGCVDFVLSLTEIPGALVTLVQTGGMDERRT